MGFQDLFGLILKKRLQADCKVPEINLIAGTKSEYGPVGFGVGSYMEDFILY